MKELDVKRVMSKIKTNRSKQVRKALKNHNRRVRVQIQAKAFRENV